MKSPFPAAAGPVKLPKKTEILHKRVTRRQSLSASPAAAAPLTQFFSKAKGVGFFLEFEEHLKIIGQRSLIMLT
jgi:hypothetical protein